MLRYMSCHVTCCLVLYHILLLRAIQYRVLHICVVLYVAQHGLRVVLHILHVVLHVLRVYVVLRVALQNCRTHRSFLTTNAMVTCITKMAHVVPQRRSLHYSSSCPLSSLLCGKWFTPFLIYFYSCVYVLYGCYVFTEFLELD